MSPAPPPAPRVAPARAPSHAPFVEALRDFHAGDADAAVRLRSNLGEDDLLPASFFFRSADELLPFERYALELCRGRVADLGAGTGVHALALQDRGFDVTAVEILPELVEIQRARGVRRAVVGDLFTWGGPRCDTILMLMNGLGPAGTLAGLDRLLSRLHGLLAPGGQILADSGEAIVVGEPEPEDLARWPPTPDAYRGEAWIELEYAGRRGAPFRELYVDMDTLSARARRGGWRCEIAFEGETGGYLARLTPVDGRGWS